MPFCNNLSAAPSRLPAITTTDVVPSPASTSCAAERSTNIFAEGCMTDMLFNIVFPSFVMIVSPLPDWIILSIPRGPREVLTASATAMKVSILYCDPQQLLHTSCSENLFASQYLHISPRISNLHLLPALP